MLLGYARVSTEEQSLNRQVDQLLECGVDKKYIFSDMMTGTKMKERKGLQDLLEYARTGDTIVITELTRLGRSMKDLLSIVDELQERGIELKSLKENIDMSTATGKAMFGMLAVMSQLERDWISERTKQGLASARSRGHNGGRPRADEQKIKTALAMYESKQFSFVEIREQTGVAKTTIYKYLKELEQKG